jgi:hypothetical protein
LLIVADGLWKQWDPREFATGRELHISAFKMTEAEPKQVNDEELRERLRVLLAASDLATTTGACVPR